MSWYAMRDRTAERWPLVRHPRPVRGLMARLANSWPDQFPHSWEARGVWSDLHGWMPDDVPWPSNDYPHTPTMMTGPFKCPDCGVWWVGFEHRCKPTATRTDTGIGTAWPENIRITSITYPNVNSPEVLD